MINLTQRNKEHGMKHIKIIQPHTTKVKVADVVILPNTTLLKQRPASYIQTFHRNDERIDGNVILTIVPDFDFAENDMVSAGVIGVLEVRCFELFKYQPSITKGSR